MNRVLGFTAVSCALAVVGCGGDANEVSPEPEIRTARPEPEGHRKMLGVLEQIAESTPNYHSDLGDEPALRLREKLRRDASTPVSLKR